MMAGYKFLSVWMYVVLLTFAANSMAEQRFESFDKDPNWDGLNNRRTVPRMVTEDFGFMAEQQRVGGRITPVAEPAFYGYRLPLPLSFNDRIHAGGKLYVAKGAGHFLLGLFNAATLNEWRTPNTMAARINGRGEGFHCHTEYCTSRWRAGAGLIRQSGIYDFKEIPADHVYEWTFDYDPNAADGSGGFTFTLNGNPEFVSINPDHRADDAVFTHFGVLPVLKSLDSPGDFWMDDVTINGVFFDFQTDPRWDSFNNRRTYETRNRRPEFDFGFSPTQHAGGKQPGEMGGLFFRGDCRYPELLAYYGDRLEPLTLDRPLRAAGKLVFMRGVSDSTTSIGFFHSQRSVFVNPSQASGVPVDFLGFNIEGPSAEGFYIYPLYRLFGGDQNAQWNGYKLRIYPDCAPHDWILEYDPQAAEGRGQMRLTLDGQVQTLDLRETDKSADASFDRFGMVTPWIDGNGQAVYLDDLDYTCR